MSADLVPKPAALPVTPVTAAERAVYGKHVFDRTRLRAAAALNDAAEQLRFAQHLRTRDRMLRTVEEDVQVVGRITDERVRNFMEPFLNATLTDLGADVRGYQQTAALQMDGILAEEYPDAPEPPPTLWEVLFERLGR
jgi:hypothetical protein